MKVQNMEGRSGEAVRNQFIIYTIGGTWFQSYDSMIACCIDGQTYLDKNRWDYSVTTGKYRNQYLGESREVTQAKIDSGEYKTGDLNSDLGLKALGLLQAV